MNGAGERSPAPNGAPHSGTALVVAETETKIETAAAERRPPAIEALDRSIADICEAVRAVLESGSINKFTEAARLCQIGHQLARARAHSIDDFEKLAAEEPMANAYVGAQVVAYNGVGNYVIGGGGGGGGGAADMAPIRAPRRNPVMQRDAGGNLVDREPGAIRRDGAGNFVNEARGERGEIVDVQPAVGVEVGVEIANAMNGVGRDDPILRDPATRRLLLAVEPMMQVQRSANAAQAAESESEELKNLLEVRSKLPKEKRAAIDARIDALVESVETRVRAREQEKASIAVEAAVKKERRENGKSALVHPDVPR